MMRIKIKDLEIFANHGVLSEENVLGQKFSVSVDMDIHTFSDDDISKTVNYAEVCSFIAQFMENNTFRLIETAAARLSAEIARHFTGIESITVGIKKPWAPIKMNLSYAGVEILRKWHKVYLSLGSNMGDKRQNLLNALLKIDADRLIRNTEKSGFIETEPWGNTEQDDFLNCCIGFETMYEPFELLEVLQKIEKQGGRTRETHWGPRTIDLDILFYDGDVINSGTLIVPHPLISEREFVLLPLCEIAPNLLHPVLKKTVRELCDGLHS